MHLFGRLGSGTVSLVAGPDADTIIMDADNAKDFRLFYEGWLTSILLHETLLQEPFLSAHLSILNRGCIPQIAWMKRLLAEYNNGLTLDCPQLLLTVDHPSPLFPGFVELTEGLTTVRSDGLEDLIHPLPRPLN